MVKKKQIPKQVWDAAAIKLANQTLQWSILKGEVPSLLGVSWDCVTYAGML